MKLKEIFSAKTAEDQERFDRIEDAYKALQSQKRMLRQGNDEIMTTMLSLASWETAAMKTTAVTGKPLPAGSMGAGVIADKKNRLRELQAEMIAQVATEERVAATNLDKVFNGPDAKEKMAEFFSTGKIDVPDSLQQKARGSYHDYLVPIALDDVAAVKDIAAKVAKPAQVNGQIKKLNALIDGGNPVNKLKRIAWQMSRKFG